MRRVPLREHVDDLREWDFWSASSLHPPMRKHAGRDARVADRAHVRSAIAECAEHVWMQHHLAHTIQRTFEVVVNWEVDQVAAIAAGEMVVHQFSRGNATRLGLRAKR